jgi:hypothetical protein
MLFHLLPRVETENSQEDKAKSDGADIHTVDFKVVDEADPPEDQTTESDLEQ